MPDISKGLPSLGEHYTTPLKAVCCEPFRAVDAGHSALHRESLVGGEPKKGKTEKFEAVTLDEFSGPFRSVIEAGGQNLDPIREISILPA
jgi:hypothetical protein